MECIYIKFIYGYKSVATFTNSKKIMKKNSKSKIGKF